MATVMAIPDAEHKPQSRVVLTQGGKGGVGKTAFATLLVDWYDQHDVDYTLLDLDIENKTRGSLRHFFPAARKLDISQPEGLDGVIDALEDGSSIVIADMGSGAGAVTHRWFDSMYSAMADMGVAFTAIGMVTPDPASIESVLYWAQALQHRVDYLIVKNSVTYPADFTYWEKTEAADNFRRAFHPAEICMEYRLPQVENPARQDGVTLRQIAARDQSISDRLKRSTTVARAQSYRRNLFAELDQVKGLLLL